MSNHNQGSLNGQAAPPVNRQVQRTKQALQDALIALIREQPYEQIDIQAIADRANTARITFYRHYRTKDDLLLDYLAQLYQDLQGALCQMKAENALDLRQAPPNLPMFVLIDQDRSLFRKLIFGPMGGVLQLHVRHYIVAQILLIFQDAPQLAGLSLTEAANHIASCTVGNILWWLTDGDHYDAEQMAHLTHTAALSGALFALGKMDLLITHT